MNAPAKNKRGGEAGNGDQSMSLFINCPYDKEYRPLFDAIVFASLCCGFEPRCAKDSGAISLARIQRITTTLRSSKYSIHDLSRCQGAGAENLARFNMPLELGMAMELGFTAMHDWAVLVPRQHAYVNYMSDLGGHDLLSYDGTPAGLVPTVMGWLATRSHNKTRTPSEVLRALPQFETELNALRQQWHEQESWNAVVDLGRRVARRNKLVSAATRTGSGPTEDPSTA